MASGKLEITHVAHVLVVRSSADLEHRSAHSKRSEYLFSGYIWKTAGHSGLSLGGGSRAAAAELLPARW